MPKIRVSNIMCPECASWEIKETSQYDRAQNALIYQYTCRDCGAEWSDNFS